MSEVRNKVAFFIRRRRAGRIRAEVVGFAIVAAALFGSEAPAQITTTIYVGRHFEVRDHEQPTKYVFNGETRVAAGIGSLSSNLRVQRLRLWAGWNLVSLAVTASDLPAQFERNQPGVVESIRQWNSSPVSYTAVVPGMAVPAGAVLWVQARENATMGIVGSYTDPSAVNLPAGGDYLPSAGLETWTPALPDNCFGWTFDPDKTQWHDRVSGALAFLSEASTSVAPGEAIYIRTDLPAELAIPPPALRLLYFHQDHLGSSSVVTDANGAALEETSFYPFGIPRYPSASDQARVPYQFTQKERDRESGLHYFEARYLDARLARFVTPDRKFAHPDDLPNQELGAFLSGPQSINLYSYTRNRPVNTVDPAGEDGTPPAKDQKPAEPKNSTLFLTIGGTPLVDSEILSFSTVQGQTGVRTEGHQHNEISELTITRTHDAASAKLFEALVKGKAVEGVVTLRATQGDHTHVYLKIQVKSAIISSYNFNGHDSQGVEALQIRGKIEFQRTDENGEGAAERDVGQQVDSSSSPRPAVGPMNSAPKPEPPVSAPSTWLWWRH